MKNKAEFILKESPRLGCLEKHEWPIFKLISRSLCGVLFINRAVLYKDAPKSIYDQGAILDKHFKEMSKICPSYKKKLIKFSKIKDKTYLNMFFLFPFLLKIFLYTKFSLWSLFRNLV